MSSASEESNKQKEKLERIRKKRLYLKNEFTEGRIKDWDNVFNLYAPSTLALEIGIHVNSFKKKVKNGRLFTLDELMRIAVLIEIDDRIIIDFVLNQIQQSKKKK